MRSKLNMPNAAGHPRTLRTSRTSRTRNPRNIRNPQRPTWRCAAAALLGVVLLAGCQSAQVAEPLTASTAGNDVASQMNFWHTLAERTLVSNDEALHAFLLYLDGHSEAESYEARVAAMKARGLLDDGYDRPANQAVRRGDLAVVICRILRIKGGVAMHLLGVNPRYATRELVYRGIYPESSEQQTFTGSDFVALIGKMQDEQTLAHAGG